MERLSSKPQVVEANTAVPAGCARPWRTGCATKNPPIIEDWNNEDKDALGSNHKRQRHVAAVRQTERPFRNAQRLSATLGIAVQ